MYFGDDVSYVLFSCDKVIIVDNSRFFVWLVFIKVFHIRFFSLTAIVRYLILHERFHHFVRVSFHLFVYLFKLAQLFNHRIRKSRYCLCLLIVCQTHATKTDNLRLLCVFLNLLHLLYLVLSIFFDFLTKYK